MFLPGSRGCDGALPLEAACATGTAAHAAAPLLSREVWVLCQALRAVWAWGMGAVAVKIKRCNVNHRKPRQSCDGIRWGASGGSRPQ